MNQVGPYPIGLGHQQPVTRKHCEKSVLGTGDPDNLMRSEYHDRLGQYVAMGITKCILSQSGKAYKEIILQEERHRSGWTNPIVLSGHSPQKTRGPLDLGTNPSSLLNSEARRPASSVPHHQQRSRNTSGWRDHTLEYRRQWLRKPTCQFSTVHGRQGWNMILHSSENQTCFFWLAETIAVALFNWTSMTLKLRGPVTKG